MRRPPPPFPPGPWRCKSVAVCRGCHRCAEGTEVGMHTVQRVQGWGCSGYIGVVQRGYILSPPMYYRGGDAGSGS